MSNFYRILSVAAAMAVLAGCSKPGVAVAPPGTAGGGVTLAPADTDSRLALGVRAMQERRIFAPAGDNAIEHYLAARAATPDDPAIAAALSELQPYAVIAIEQATARGDSAEAGRLIALIARGDPAAPALPRLRAGVVALTATTAAERDRAVAEVAALALAEKRQVEQLALARPATPAPRKLPDSTVAAVRTEATDAAVAVSPPPAARPIPDPAPVQRAVPATGAVENRPTRVAAGATPPDSRGALPRLLSQAPPRYPQTAMNRKIEGKVDVAFTIQPDGSVGDMRVVAAEPSGTFDKAALTAVSRYRFEASGQRHATTRSLVFSLTGVN